MEKLTTIQQARLDCLKIANDYANQSPTSKTKDYEFHISQEETLRLAEKYLNYILEGASKNQTA